MTLDTTRLIKLMGMCSSSHDGEALNALRLAQKLLEENKTTWKELLSRPQPIQTYSYVHKPAPPRPSYEDFAAPPQNGATKTDPAIVRRNIDAEFKLVMASTMSESFAKFIHNIYDQYKKSGRLTDNQRTALRQAAKKVREGKY